MQNDYFGALGEEFVNPNFLKSNVLSTVRDNKDSNIIYPYWSTQTFDDNDPIAEEKKDSTSYPLHKA